MSDKMRLTEEPTSFNETVQALRHAENHLIIVADENGETTVYTDVSQLNALGMLLQVSVNLINAFPEDMSEMLGEFVVDGPVIHEDLRLSVEAIQGLISRLLAAGVKP